MATRTSERVVVRPYKVRIEVVKGSKNTVSLVGNSSRMMNAIVEELRSAGFKEALVYVDAYGYLRVVYRGLSDDGVSIIRSIVKDVMSSRKVNAKRDYIYEKLMIAS